MTRKGRAIVTERFQATAPDTLLRIELWAAVAPVSARFQAAFGVPLPGPNRAAAGESLRAIWREPDAWMIRAPLATRDTLVSSLEAVVGADGAVTDISGAAARCRLTGADWRILLTHGGVFDAEDPAFAPGCVAGTVVEHMAVRFDVISQTEVDAYVAPSYAADLFAYWTSVARSLDVRG